MVGMYISKGILHGGGVIISGYLSGGICTDTKGDTNTNYF